MARIRSVHPGLFTDEAFVSVSPLARLLWVGIWTEADDHGAFEWKPLTMKMRILPADHADVPTLLAELEAADMVRRYSVDGRDYGAVRNFGRFQRPKKPNSVHPMPPEFRTYAATDDASSEPSDDEGGPSSPPVPNRSPLKPRGSSPPVPPKAEKSPQMEDGGGNRREGGNPPREREGGPGETRAAVAKGARLPADWKPDEGLREFARTLHLDPDRVTASFCDFWHGKAGADARKVDWSATWRNWCRREADSNPAARAHNGRRATLPDYVFDEPPNLFPGDGARVVSSTAEEVG